MKTVFSTMSNIQKGGVEIVGEDEKKHYLFSNVYEVAKNADLYERVVIAKNLEYTVEVSRGEGESNWYICAHDETVVCMEGEFDVHFLKPADGDVAPAAEVVGAIKLAVKPEGQKMGLVKMKLGHQALLPAGAAYRFSCGAPAVLMYQSLLGAESVERWKDIIEM